MIVPEPHLAPSFATGVAGIPLITAFTATRLLVQLALSDET